jgi:hypothetical protein
MYRPGGCLIGALAALACVFQCASAQTTADSIESVRVGEAYYPKTMTLSVDAVNPNGSGDRGGQPGMDFMVPLGIRLSRQVIRPDFGAPFSIEIAPSTTAEGVSVEIALQELEFTGDGDRETRPKLSGERSVIKRVVKQGDVLTTPWFDKQFRIKVETLQLQPYLYHGTRPPCCTYETLPKQKPFDQRMAE